MFMTARSQAQNSADAGALAGAIALALRRLRRPHRRSGPAVQSALEAARGNQVMVGADVSVDAGRRRRSRIDPTGLNNRVRVNVYRTRRAAATPCRR